jgi:hypothetical protein
MHNSLLAHGWYLLQLMGRTITVAFEDISKIIVNFKILTRSNRLQSSVWLVNGCKSAPLNCATVSEASTKKELQGVGICHAGYQRNVHINAFMISVRASWVSVKLILKFTYTLNFRSKDQMLVVDKRMLLLTAAWHHLLPLPATVTYISLFVTNKVCCHFLLIQFDFCAAVLHASEIHLSIWSTYI